MAMNWQNLKYIGMLFLATADIVHSGRSKWNKIAAPCPTLKTEHCFNILDSALPELVN